MGLPQYLHCDQSLPWSRSWEVWPQLKCCSGFTGSRWDGQLWSLQLEVCSILGPRHLGAQVLVLAVSITIPLSPSFMIYILHLGILLAQIGYDFLNDLDTQVATSEDNSFEEFYNSLYICVVFVAFYCPFVQKSY